MAATRRAAAAVAATPSKPTDLVLALSRTTFATHTDLFRAEIYTVGGELPIRIWMESRRSKGQWECTVMNFDDHRPAGASYSLPPTTVLTALMSVLTCTSKRNDETCSESCEHYDIDLQSTPQRRLSLSLSMKAFVGLCAEYTFILTPIAMEALDIIHAKVRDLEDEVAELREENRRLRSTNHRTTGKALPLDKLEMSSSHDTDAFDHIAWTVPTHLPSSFMSINSDHDVLTAHRDGLYHIQVSGSCTSSGGVVVLYHNDNKIAVASAIKQDDGASTKYQIQLSVMVQLAVDATIEVCFLSKSPCGHTQCAPSGTCARSKMNKRAKLVVHAVSLLSQVPTDGNVSTRSAAAPPTNGGDHDSDTDVDIVTVKRERKRTRNCFK
ncbi:hypothetical protein H310_11125 [Aphanomyces invadans]|uniref:Uncharacterized protein n=1 Tax=Aphanomyces invadans TaxID=157072 RepID=A0A024TNW1_9STRA|nr:hypothetical protein H310_11125 [Aphanomyces invadans]ETV95708.1 hypothetical protein H310_11125 [Aphanomyces invadans]|eukprot:XP_008875901.1 hypothetical protein H310_11125 [Aphanomyces invadans]